MLLPAGNFPYELKEVRYREKILIKRKVNGFIIAS